VTIILAERQLVNAEHFGNEQQGVGQRQLLLLAAGKAPGPLLNVAAEMCERAVFMEKGAIRFEGPTRDLLERHDIARAVFLGAAGQSRD
jgi:hypothetical protein